MKTIIVALLAASICGIANAESIEGIMENGSTYSSIFTVSDESGDLIGYAFKNQTAAGKNILGNCVSGMPCKIVNAKTREFNGDVESQFNYHPSGWIEIIAAKNVQVTSAASDYKDKVKTRFGLVSFNEDTRTLYYKGKEISPPIEGNNGLSIVNSYELGNNDVLLLLNDGGSACPAQYRFLTISAKGINATPEFGTCSDIIYPVSDLKTNITVSMIGYMGEGEPKAAQKKAAMTKYVYRFANGIVTENGKVIK